MLSINFCLEKEAIGSFLQTYLPEYVGRAVEEVRVGNLSYLTGREVLPLKRMALRRQQEFASGRMAARRALAQICGPSEEILMQDDRSPRWPAGFVGSIAHCDTIALSVVGRCDQVSSLGVDIEQKNAAETELWDVMFRQEEIASLVKLDSDSQIQWATAAFSAKETLFKFQFPLTRQWLDLRDAAVTFINETQFKIEIFNKPFVNQIRQSVFIGNYNFTEHHVLTCLWRHT